MATLESVVEILTFSGDPMNSTLLYMAIATPLFFSLYHILLLLQYFRAALIALWILFLVSLPFSLPWLIIHILFTIRVTVISVGRSHGYTLRGRVGLHGFFYYKWHDIKGLLIMNFIPLITLLAIILLLVFVHGHKGLAVAIVIYAMLSLNILMFALMWGSMVYQEYRESLPCSRGPVMCTLTFCGAVCCFPIFLVIGNVFAVFLWILAFMKALDVVVLLLLRADDPYIGEDLKFVHSDAIEQHNIRKRAKRMEREHCRFHHFLSLFKEERKCILMDRLQQQVIVNIILDYMQQLERSEVFSALMDANVVAKSYNIDLSLVSSWTQKCEHQWSTKIDSRTDPLLATL